MAFNSILLENNFQTLANIAETVSVMLGLVFVFSAIFQFKKMGEQRSMMGQHSAAGPVIMLVCGAALLILPQFIGAAALAFWGQQSDVMYTGGPTGYHPLIPPILMLVRLVGVVAFIRGIVMLSKTGSQQGQQGQLGKALTHIFSGILCVHIMQTIDLLQTILGLN